MSDYELTPTQARVLAYVAKHITQVQRPPTRREIAAEFGWKSLNAAEEVIQALNRKGFIELTGSADGSQWQRYIRVLRWPDSVLPIIRLASEAVA